MTLTIIITLLVIHTIREIDFYLSIKQETTYKSTHKKRKSFKKD